MRAALMELELSTRAYQRILDLVRTTGGDDIKSAHFMETLQYLRIDIG